MWGGASALCLMSGKQSEDDSYKKSIALQLHLLAWELPDTVMVSVCVLCVLQLKKCLVVMLRGSYSRAAPVPRADKAFRFL